MRPSSSELIARLEFCTVQSRSALNIKLLRRFRRADVNLRAAWTMSLNDFASNFGIVLAGVVGSNWPDIAIALVIAAVASYGGVKTLLEARRDKRAGSGSSGGGVPGDSEDGKAR